MSYCDYYEELSLQLLCEFCQIGPLECACEDVEVDFAPQPSIDDSLELCSIQFSVTSKLGSTKVDTLFDELDLNPNDVNSWKTLESLAMW